MDGGAESGPPEQVLQLLALRASVGMGRLMRKFASPGAELVLDLEDGLWTPGAEEETRQRKAESREALRGLLRDSPGLVDELRLGLRLNSRGTAEYGKDLELLRGIGSGVAWRSFLLTKVESAAGLHGAAEDLRAAGVRVRRLVPIVETRAGMEALPEVLVAARELGCTHVVRGHYDLCLDTGVWPFPELDSATYREAAEVFIATVGAAGLGFCQPPFFGLEEDDALRGILAWLRSVASKPVAVMTFAPHQTRVAMEGLRAPLPPVPPPGPDFPDDPAERRRLAELTLEVFERAGRADASFAVDPRHRRFHSPHQLVAACRVLGRPISFP